MVDIASVGAATFDVFVHAPHTTVASEAGEPMIQFPLGSKVKVEGVSMSCGGGAANTSIGFSRLGLRARFCGVIGSDEWGETIQHVLLREGVLLDAATIVEEEISNFSIIFSDPSGERTILYASNVSHHLSDPLFPKQLMRESRWLFLNHLAEASCAILDDCLEVVKKPGGLRLAWNPGGSQLREGVRDRLIRDLLRSADLLFLNAEEAMQMMRQDSVEETMREGAAAGVRIMCVTDGAKGAMLSDGKTIYRCGALPVAVVDATGAGDAFGVGVTWAIAQELDLRLALKAGILSAASVIGAVGAQAGLLREQEMRSRLESTSLPITTSTL